MEKWEHTDKPLRDLMEIIHFTENVSAKIHGLLDEAEIYRTVREEFAKSERYSASIVLLTGDGSKLRIAETSLPAEKLKAGEKATGLRLKGYRIDLNKSSIYSQVVREGKGIQVSVSDTIGELLPQPLAYLISKTMGYEGRNSVLTPLQRHGKIIGALAMSSTDLVEHFIPSVRNLARHISTALEMADEHAELRRTEEALRRAHDELERRVEERTARLTAANEQLNGEITDRKRVEEALRESEEKYRHVVERANDGIAIVQDRVIRYANPRLAQMWGGAVQEIIDTPFTDYAHPDELPKVIDRYQRRMAGEEVTPIYESAVKHKEGHTVHVEFNAGVTTYQGKPADLVIVRDITERKRREGEIRRRSEELGALNAVAATVSSSVDLHEILDRALDKVLEVAGVEIGSVYLLDEQAEELVLATHRGLPEKFADQVCTLKVSESLTGRVVQSREPIVVDDLIGDPRATTGLANKEGIRSFAAIPMKSRQKVQGVMYIGSHEYHPFSPDEVRLYTAIANQIGVAIQNAQLWNATKRRLQESTILLEVSRALASVLELEELLQMIIDSAVETIEGAPSGVIHLLDDGSGELHPQALAGEPPRVTTRAGMRIGKGIAGYALEQGEVVNVPDVDGDPRFIALEGDQELRSLLVAPLLAEGRRMGTISIKSKRIGAFTTEDERLLMTLAAHAAAAVRNAQLFARSEELAIAKERNRIANDVHHGLANNLASLLMKIDLCRGLVESHPQETKARLEEVKEVVGGSIQEVGRAIFALQLPGLDELGFLPALREYTQGLRKQNELLIHLSIVGEEVQSQLPSSYQYALFRIVQEALNNVTKHAEAQNVWIVLDLSAPNVVSLTVRDDGLGFDKKVEETAKPAWIGGYGLAGMRQRTKALGGELIVEAEAGLGTKIRAILPLGKRGK